jgi:hypothetical protein
MFLVLGRECCYCAWDVHLAWFDAGDKVSSGVECGGYHQ